MCVLVGQFKQTDYGLIDNIITDAYHGPTYGSRASGTAAVPLIFLVSDGKMTGMLSHVYDANGCPEDSSYKCGEYFHLDKNWEFRCQACWRKSLVQQMDGVHVSLLMFNRLVCHCVSTAMRCCCRSVESEQLWHLIGWQLLLAS